MRKSFCVINFPNTFNKKAEPSFYRKEKQAGNIFECHIKRFIYVYIGENVFQFYTFLIYIFNVCTK